MLFPKFTLVYFKGGGGGGGSSGSGQIDYPDYMETWHGQALDHAGADTPTSSITDLINAALGNSPYTGETAYDPDTEVANIIAAPDDLETLVDLLSTGTTLDDVIANILDEDRIDDAVDEYSDDLGARLTAEVLPRFEAGMRDINAVMSSAFVIGRALIEDGQTRQVAKYSADLHLKAWGDDAIRVIALKLQYQSIVSNLTAETNRLKIVAKSNEIEENLKIDKKDALWDLELYKYGVNLLAGISGGTVDQDDREPSTAQQAIGGALSGAAAGAMIAGASGGAIAGPVGILGGMALGAASAFL